MHGTLKLLDQRKRKVGLGEVAHGRTCMLAIMGGIEGDLERGALRGTRGSCGGKSLGKRGVGRLALGRHHVILERAGAGELGVGGCIGSGGVLRLSGLAGVSRLRRYRRLTGLSWLD